MVISDDDILDLIKVIMIPVQLKGILKEHNFTMSVEDQQIEAVRTWLYFHNKLTVKELEEANISSFSSECTVSTPKTVTIVPFRRK